jgi:hypothetical protein
MNEEKEKDLRKYEINCDNFSLLLPKKKIFYIIMLKISKEIQLMRVLQCENFLEYFCHIKRPTSKLSLFKRRYRSKAIYTSRI